VQSRNVAIELGSGIEGWLGMLRFQNGTTGHDSARDKSCDAEPFEAENLAMGNKSIGP
jgi:hypothetical protein